MAVFTVTGDTAPEIGGAATDDRYVLDAFNVEPNQELTITDTLGANVIQLTGGLEIASSSVTSNALQLTLDNGAVITILGADTFDFQTGGNGVNGTGGLTESFDDFVTNSLGLPEVPAEGDAPESGGAVTVEENGGTTGGDPGDPGDPGTPGQTFNLTPGTDGSPEFDGTDDNDTYVGALSSVQDGSGFTELQTLTTTDVLDGGLGTDVLDATLINNSGSGTTVTPESIESIEQFFLTARGAAQTVDMSNVNGVEQVWSDGSTRDLTIDNLNDEVVAGVIGGNGSVYTLNYATGVTSADFTQAVVLDNADIATLYVDDADNNITGLSIDATGDDTELEVASDLELVTDLTISGDAALELSTDPSTPSGSGSGSAAFDVLETLTSTSTGDITVAAGDFLETASFDEGSDTLTTGGAAVESIGMGAGDDDVTIVAGDLNDGAAIDMGDDDDRLDLGDNFNASNTASLNGGAGTNTLAMTSAKADELSVDGVDFDQSFENFQKLEVGEVATGDNDVVDLSNMNDIDYVISAGTGPTTGTAEVQTIDLGSSNVDGGVLTVGGVDITIPSNPGSVFGNQFSVAGAIEAQEAAIIAANPDIVSVERVNNGLLDWDVEVTYNTTSGDVGNITVVENPSNVGFGQVDPTDGTDEMAQIDTLTVSTAPTASGLITVSIDNDGSGATTETDIQVEVFAGETVNQVAAKISDAIDATILSGVSSVSAIGDTVTVNYNAAVTGVEQINFDDTGTTGTVVTEATAQPYSAPVAESQTVEITNGTDATGGEIVVAGVRIELDGGLTPNQVAGEILNNLTAIQNASDVVGISFNSTTDELTFTFDEDAGDVGPIEIEDNTTTGVNASVSESIPGVAGAAAGALTLDEMASGGTLEIIDENAGVIDVLVTDAFQPGNDSDVLNILLNDADALPTSGSNVGAGQVNAFGVETVNIETDNSGDDAPTDNTRIDLIAPDAETVTVSGNHGVVTYFSWLEDMTLFDGSGVVAVDSAPGADDAGSIGRIAIDDMADDADVTILTGNGDDYINAFVVGLGTTDEVGATIDAGAGDDDIVGSEGDDMITAGEGDDVVNSTGGEDMISLGDGNDTYALLDTGDSVINARDVITDFSPNTVGQGTGGAATGAGAVASVDDRDGDVIDLSGVPSIDNTVSVEVFANASDATTFLANNDNDGDVNVALDSSTSFLYIDSSDDGIANSVIELTGVTSIDEAAFEIV